MSGPPLPPHLTTNYQQLLTSNNHTQSGISNYATSNNKNVPSYHTNSCSDKTHFEHDRGFEPQAKKQRYERNDMVFNSGAAIRPKNDFPHDDPSVIAKGKEIVQLLKQFPRPLSTKEIVKNCGHYFKHPLHPILINLNDRGLILKQYGYGLESWRFNANPPSPGSTAPYPQKSPQHHVRNSSQNPAPNFQDQLPNLQQFSGPPGINFHHHPHQNRQHPSKSSPSASECTNQRSSVVVQAKKNPTKNFLISTDVYNALNKSPISALNELVQKNGASLSFELLCENRGNQKNKFTVAAMINDKMYDAVSASNMKDAKRDAADAALRIILKEHTSSASPQNFASLTSSNATHFDRIAALSHQAFIDKSTMVKEKFAGRKVVACMIMKRDYDDQGTVIALGTGNRCITGQRLSMEGKVVNDSHAEIICRRAFLSFLYAELNKHHSNQGQSIFEEGGYGGHSKVRDGVSFHLYISTAPCGDGALFTPRLNDNQVENFPTEHLPTFSAKSHGTTRSKIEDGEGTIPIDSKDSIQTFDGILRGQRLRTMSCSDKICRWNVVGLQGALLSHLIDPIYLESLTLGYLYDHGHLSRAVCCRLDKGDVQKLDNILPMPYYLNHPWLGRVTQHQASRETEKTNNISINWNVYDQTPEVTDGRTGAQLSRTGGAPTPSRLCKLELLKRFRNVVRENAKYSHLLGDFSYGELKDKAVDFQNAKRCMIERFQMLKLGPWVKKPKEQDFF